MRWQRNHFEFKETIVTFLCDGRHVLAGQEALINGRKILEDYIQKDPVFKTTHSPHRPLDGSPDLVRVMCVETEKVGVGPMAAVAGALAYVSLKALLQAEAKEAVVDNGGDVAFFIRKSIRVGIFAGDSQINNLIFELDPRPEPFGICTSSGTVGPSFSYGKADAAVIVSPNVVLADAAATALGNRVNRTDNLETCFDFMESIQEIEGALVIFKDQVAMWGKLPKLVRSKINIDLITRGRIEG